MGWQAFYDDLSAFSSETGDKPQDLPLEGIQVVRESRVINGVLRSAARSANVFSWENGGVYGDSLSLAEVKRQRPNAVWREGRTCSVRRFHEIELAAGLWSPRNKVPFDGWMKDLIGWRLWTSTQMFDSKGVEEADWLSLWASLPTTDIQFLKLYENWKTVAGTDYYQNHSADFYFMAPSPHGILVAASAETDLETRYPGAVVKQGTQLPDNEFAEILKVVQAATVL